MRRPILLPLFCLLMWLPGFFTIPPSDRDESRFAQASKQMIETGNFVAIRNGTEARNRKPIGIYWLQVPFAEAARAAHVATENPIWPYRLPSLIGGLLAVWLTWRIGGVLVGRHAALIGATILAASVILAVETHMAKTDAALLAATTAAMGVLARAYLEPDTVGKWAAAGFWAAMAAGILIKGPITPMVAGLAVIALLIADRRAAWLSCLRWRWGVPLMLVLVLPWFIAIGIESHGKFFSDAIGGELASKIRSGDDSHGAPPGLHFLLIGLTLFPGSLAVLRALPGAWWARRDAAIRFMIAWVVPSWIVFEAVPTKLPHYVLPLFPPLCLLAGRWLVSNGHTPRWMRVLSAALFIAGTAVLALGALALPFVAVPGITPYDLLGIPAAVAVTFIAWLALRRNVRHAILAAPLYAWAILGLELPSLRPLWIAPRVEAALVAHGGGALGTVGYNEPSLMFLCGTDIYFAPNAAGGAAWMAAAPGRVVAVADRDRAAFLHAAETAGLTPQPFASIPGYNYSHGRRVVLTMYAQTPRASTAASTSAPAAGSIGCDKAPCATAPAAAPPP